MPESHPLRILVTGCNGRMGQSVIACCDADSAVEVVAAIDIGDRLDDALATCDSVIDFSSHSLTDHLVAACVAQRKQLVIGTTGQSDDALRSVREAARSIAIVMAPNFSVGVNAMFWLTEKAAGILGPAFDLEVVEMHHRHKVDAPSGTAKRLAEILADARGLNYADAARHGRDGMVGARAAAEIGIHSLRGGDVVGDHTVVFAHDGERVELTHKASSRATFAAGAVRAAKWLASQPSGHYDMQDVLGLRDSCG